jgi:hypothetical protein
MIMDKNDHKYCGCVITTCGPCNVSTIFMRVNVINLCLLFLMTVSELRDIALRVIYLNNDFVKERSSRIILLIRTESNCTL